MLTQSCSCSNGYVCWCCTTYSIWRFSGSSSISYCVIVALPPYLFFSQHPLRFSRDFLDFTHSNATFLPLTPLWYQTIEPIPFFAPTSHTAITLCQSPLFVSACAWCHIVADRDDRASADPVRTSLAPSIRKLENQRTIDASCVSRSD